MNGREAHTRCTHDCLTAAGLCAVCGECPHEIVLNGACYACGATDVTLHNKPTDEDAVVPTTRLARRR